MSLIHVIFRAAKDMLSQSRSRVCQFAAGGHYTCFARDSNNLDRFFQLNDLGSKTTFKKVANLDLSTHLSVCYFSTALHCNFSSKLLLYDSVINIFVAVLQWLLCSSYCVDGFMFLIHNHYLFCGRNASIMSYCICISITGL